MPVENQVQNQVGMPVSLDPVGKPSPGTYCAGCSVCSFCAFCALCGISALAGLVGVDGVAGVAFFIDQEESHL